MAGRRDDGGVPVDLHRVGYECRARWGTGNVYGPDRLVISVGQLDDGRWYVHITGGPHRPTYAYPTKQRAWIAVQKWMASRDSEWERVPCYPTQAARDVQATAADS